MAAGPVGPGGPGDPTVAAPGYAPQPVPPGGPGYPPQQGYGQGYPPQQQGGQGHDYAAEAAAFSRRHIRTPETKEFFKTSEFAVWGLTFLCVVIAGLISETLFSDKVWLYVTIVSSAYILSRGIAKAAARRGDPESHFGHDH